MTQTRKQKAAGPRGRRGSFVVRQALRRVAPRQSRGALLSAGLMGLALPCLQAALVVGVAAGELWQGLFAFEGGLIALLAMQQFRRSRAEGRLFGFGLLVLNMAGLSIAGLFLGGHIYWISSLLALGPTALLALAPTGRRTVPAGWVLFCLPMLLLFAGLGWCRYSLERAAQEEDPQARSRYLEAAWIGLRMRGGNETERALLRLRQSQAAFEAGEYRDAFEFAHDGMVDPRGDFRPIPDSAIGRPLLQSLLQIKAQAHYNETWGKNAPARTYIPGAPLDRETLSLEDVRVGWGY